MSLKGMKPMKKSKMAVVLAFMMACCLGLCACGGSSSTSSSASSSSNAANSSASESASSSSATEASSSSSTGASSNASASSSSAADVDNAAFVGEWKIVAMSDGTNVLRVEDADESQKANLNIVLSLNDDGTASFKNSRGTLTGAWFATGETSLTINFEPNDTFSSIPSYDAELDDGTLAIQENGLVMLLERD